jgi:hypothetical protein
MVLVSKGAVLVAERKYSAQCTELKPLPPDHPIGCLVVQEPGGTQGAILQGRVVGAGQATPPFAAGVVTVNVSVPSPHEAEQDPHEPWQSTGQACSLQARGDVGQAVPPLAAG